FHFREALATSRELNRAGVARHRDHGLQRLLRRVAHASPRIAGDAALSEALAPFLLLTLFPLVWMKFPLWFHLPPTRHVDLHGLPRAAHPAVPPGGPAGGGARALC